MKSIKLGYFFLSLLLAGILLLAYLAHAFEIQFLGLDALLQTLMLPALVAQLLALVYGIIRYRKKMEWEVLAGILVLSISSILSLGSLLM